MEWCLVKHRDNFTFTLALVDWNTANIDGLRHQARVQTGTPKLNTHNTA